MRIVRATLMVLLVFASPADAQDEIFSDDFETGRTCWIWSATIGGRDLCFDMPYGVPPPVEVETAGASTKVVKSDVVFAMDTTGSMGDEIAKLQTSIATLLDVIGSQIPNTGFGVVGYEDFPCCGYGSAPDGDRAFYLLHRVMTVSTSDGRASLVNAVDQYQTRNGLDPPESGWEMAFQVATGFGNGTGPNSVPPFDPVTAPPASPPAGEEIGEIGGVGFRPGSLPIMVWITDAASHNSGGGGNPYGPIPGVTPVNYAQARVAMVDKGGRIIGVLSGEAGRDNLRDGVIDTGAVVTPDAWGVTGRPPGCSPSQCCTGLDGTGVTPVGGECPLLFDVDSSGSGLGTAVVDGIERLIESVVIDVGARLVDDPSDPVNAVDEFVDRLEADAAAPLPCAQGLVAVDINPPDGIPDTFVDVAPGTTVCFNVVVKSNATVPSSGVEQVYPATLEAIGDNVTVLEDRRVFFRVPP